MEKCAPDTTLKFWWSVRVGTQKKFQKCGWHEICLPKPLVGGQFLWTERPHKKSENMGLHVIRGKIWLMIFYFLSDFGLTKWEQVIVPDY